MRICVRFMDYIDNKDILVLDKPYSVGPQATVKFIEWLQIPDPTANLLKYSHRWIPI